MMRPWHVLAGVALAVAGLFVGGLLRTDPKVTHAHTYQECLAKANGALRLPCFVIDDGVLVERRDDPAT